MSSQSWYIISTIISKSFYPAYKKSLDKPDSISSCVQLVSSLS